MKLTPLARSSGKSFFSIFTIIWKYKYWFVLAMIILPSIIQSVQVAVETNNPTYPFFQLATRLFVADQHLEDMVIQLQENPKEIIGIDMPSEGIWNTTKYLWFLWWRAIFVIISDVWLIFFPLYLIYHMIKGRNVSEPYRNMMKAFWYFILYLFITNTVILVYDLIVGNILITLPETGDKYISYLIILIELLPFHGLGNLMIYLFDLL